MLFLRNAWCIPGSLCTCALCLHPLIPYRVPWKRPSNVPEMSVKAYLYISVFHLYWKVVYMENIPNYDTWLLWHYNNIINKRGDWYWTFHVGNPSIYLLLFWKGFCSISFCKAFSFLLWPPWVSLLPRQGT